MDTSTSVLIITSPVTYVHHCTKCQKIGWIGGQISLPENITEKDLKIKDRLVLKITDNSMQSLCMNCVESQKTN